MWLWIYWKQIIHRMIIQSKKHNHLIVPSLSLTSPLSAKRRSRHCKEHRVRDYVILSWQLTETKQRRNLPCRWSTSIAVECMILILTFKMQTSRLIKRSGFFRPQNRCKDDTSAWSIKRNIYLIKLLFDIVLYVDDHIASDRYSQRPMTWISAKSIRIWLNFSQHSPRVDVHCCSSTTRIRTANRANIES